MKKRSSKGVFSMITDFELPRQTHVRDDGLLVELISMNHSDVPFTCVHSYLVVIKPGCFRAMHYHKTKEEWVAHTSGNINIVLEEIRTNRRKEISMDVTMNNYALIYIPPMVAHVIKNIGSSNASIVVFSKSPEIKGDTIAYKMEI
jgi:dTDP-4-dehydrorhamnose 3,5-epimerase-like enzyme